MEKKIKDCKSPFTRAKDLTVKEVIYVSDHKNTQLYTAFFLGSCQAFILEAKGRRGKNAKGRRSEVKLNKLPDDAARGKNGVFRSR